MKLVHKATIGVAAVLALAISGAGVAVAQAPGVPAPHRQTAAAKSATASALAHTDAIGPSTSLPAIQSSFHADVTPCRLADTARRGGKILNNHTRSLKLRGTSSLDGQGGSLTGCGIPDTASAVDVLVTVSGATAKSGYLTWTTTGASAGLRFVSYTKNQTVSTPALLRIPTTLTTFDGALKNVGGAAHVSLVATGYEAPPIQGLISGTGTVYSGTKRILSAVVNDVGNITVTVDQDVTYCTPIAHPYYPNYYGSVAGLSGNTVNVRLWSLSGGTITPVSTYFYLTVIC